jgi:hypothetical protein
MPISLIDIIKQQNRQSNISSGSFFFMADSPDINFKVNGIQVDENLNPGSPPTLNSRYIVSNIQQIHSNFGSTDGWSNNDIVRYNGSNFELLLSKANNKQSGTIVFNEEDKNFYGFNGTFWFEFRSIGVTGPTGTNGATGAIGPTGATGPGYINAQIRNNNLYVTEILSNGTTSELNLGYVGPTGSDFIFDENLIANFKEGKSFGRFVKGDSVFAQGKSAVEIIKEAFSEPLDPIVSLTRSPQSISFNQTSPTITLSFNYTIASQGAGASSANLEFRLANSPSWSSLTSGTGLTTFIHSPSLPSGNTQSLFYRYTVVDTEGASGSTTTSVSQTQYLPIIFNFAQSKINSSSLEVERFIGNSVTLRERDNNQTKLSNSPSSNGNIVITNRNQGTFVPIRFWSIEKRINNETTWTSLTSQSGEFTSSTISIPEINDDTPNSNKITYRIRANDDFSEAISQLTPINIISPIFFGGTSDSFEDAIQSGSDIRSYVESQTRQNGAIIPPSNNTFVIKEFNGDKSLFIALPTSLVLTSALNTTLNQPYFGQNTASGFELIDGITTIPLFQEVLRNYNIYFLSVPLPAANNSDITIIVTGQADPQ